MKHHVEIVLSGHYLESKINTNMEQCEARGWLVEDIKIIDPRRVLILYVKS